MTTYEFTLMLDKQDLSGADCDSLYEAGCADATIVTREGKSFLEFDRESETLETAIRSAINETQSVGLEVENVIMPALV